MNSLLDICFNYLVNNNQFSDYVLLNKLPLELYQEYQKKMCKKICGNNILKNVIYNEIKRGYIFLPSEQISILQAINNKWHALYKCGNFELNEKYSKEICECTGLFKNFDWKYYMKNFPH